jgi:Tfp pilus assembly protein PilO
VGTADGRTRTEAGRRAITLKAQWLQKKAEAVNLEQYQQQLSDIDRSFGALLKQLPNKAEMESLLVDISQAGLSRGLQFETWRPGSESVKDFYAELPITLRVTGGYHDLGSFRRRCRQVVAHSDHRIDRHRIGQGWPAEAGRRRHDLPIS